MADATKDALEAIYGRASSLRGGFQGLGQGQGPMPFRPPSQPVSEPPSRLYVDQVENGHATYIDPQGNATTGAAVQGAHEGRMADGSASPPGHHPHYLPWPEDGIIRLGEELPKVPLAPGSPGPPVPPGQNAMLDQKKPGQQKKRRVVP